QKDPAFANVDISSALDAERYIGRAPEQVDAFLSEIIMPLVARYGKLLSREAEDVQV
ncbi:MAG: adenylosuccinate lyase, partial [Planctomycetes bacterium]|nr:adenylosuccinate lyase [Planctomycetota bacterium]